jgi:hypothetical protein
VGSGVAAVFERPSREAVQASERLNALVDRRYTTVAAPALGAAVSLPILELGLYDDLRKGRAPEPEDLARRYAALCREGAASYLVEGKRVEDPAELQAALVGAYGACIERIVPLWRMMGIVPGGADG